MRPLPMADLPQRWSVKDAPRDHAVLELPLGSVVGDLGAMYRAMDHGSPVVNGYSGFEPVHYRILRDALAGGDTDALAGLARHAPLLVVNGEHATVFGPLRFDDERRDEPIGVRSVDVDGNAVDGQTLSTAPGAGWSVGAVQPSGVVTIDLGSVREVSAIVLRLGVHILEYPRELAIETSTDARAWRTAWAGHCAGRAVAGALDDPAAVPLTFAFAPSAARWVRLRQLGRDRQARWTFAALTVRGR
jgi:F5/8 type C domain